MKIFELLNKFLNKEGGRFNDYKFLRYQANRYTLTCVEIGENYFEIMKKNMLEGHRLSTGIKYTEAEEEQLDKLLRELINYLHSIFHNNAYEYVDKESGYIMISYFVHFLKINDEMLYFDGIYKVKEIWPDLYTCKNGINEEIYSIPVDLIDFKYMYEIIIRQGNWNLKKLDDVDYCKLASFDFEEFNSKEIQIYLNTIGKKSREIEYISIEDIKNIFENSKEKNKD